MDIYTITIAAGAAVLGCVVALLIKGCTGVKETEGCSKRSRKNRNSGKNQSGRPDQGGRH
jgi:hypothetical protein